MQNAKIYFSYDGSRFNGYAVQSHDKNSVEGKINEVLESLNLDKLISSSRTDKGVHALNNVALIKLKPYWSDLEKLRYNINKFIKPNIYINKIELIGNTFHPRFNAKARLYRYIISHDNFCSIKSNYVLYHDEIDIEKINFALKYFIGIHDFKYFKKSKGAGKSNIRQIYNFFAYRYKNNTIFYIKASSFLRGQVRMMISAILNYHDNKITLKNLQEQILAKHKHSFLLAPPNGLYLCKIYY